MLLNAPFCSSLGPLLCLGFEPKCCMQHRRTVSGGSLTGFTTRSRQLILLRWTLRCCETVHIRNALLIIKCFTSHSLLIHLIEQNQSSPHICINNSQRTGYNSYRWGTLGFREYQLLLRWCFSDGIWHWLTGAWWCQLNSLMLWNDVL